MMERRFDMSDFEQSLKDNADQFTLVPSSRIWNGIYNNLHPGSKWPSITVAIVFIITLFTIGFLNNSSKKLSSEEVSISSVKSVDKNYLRPQNSIEPERNSVSAKKTNTEKNTSSKKETSVSFFDNNENAQKGGNEKLSASIDAKHKTPFQSSSNTFEKNISDNGIGNYEFGNQSLIEVGNKEISTEDYNLFVAPVQQPPINEFMPAEADYSNYIEGSTLIKNTEDFSSSARLKTSSGNIDTHIHPLKKTISQSKKIHKKRNKNIEWTYYVTPTVSMPLFRNSSLASSVNFSPLAIFQNASSNGMIYNANFGFETGVKISYTLSKKWKVFSGFNLNYSDYNLISNLLHPTFATLTLKDKNTGIPYSKSYITFYGNGQSLNQVALTNYSLQFSIPVGLEYQVWGNKNIQISIASAIEPSVVLKSNSYIISADKRYYVQDPDLMRRMNLGGSFGTFINFGSNKIKWQIGPDIHYQLLSTYKNTYLSQEHLIDYGIRIGISRKY